MSKEEYRAQEGNDLEIITFKETIIKERILNSARNRPNFEGI